MFRFSPHVVFIASLGLAAGAHCFAMDPDPATNAADTAAVTADVAAADAAANAAATPATAPAGAVAYSYPASGERFHRYVKSLFGPGEILWGSAAAGLTQTTNTPSEWGQGADGYFRRFGNSYGEHLIRSTIRYGVGEALGEDNHYYVSGEHGFGKRTMYAVESTFVARRPDGSRRVSYSRLTALVATAFISRAWQPPSTRGPVHAVGSFSTALGGEVGFNVVREFWSDLLHRSH